MAIPIFLYVASLGMIFPNATAGALAEQSEHAGSASALIGSLQYGRAAVASSLVSCLGNGTSLPMTAHIGACGIAAFLALNLFIAPKKQPDFNVTDEHISLG